MWHYLIRPCRNGALGWIAFAKPAPFIKGGGLDEPGPIWFEFGATEIEALEKIQAEVRRLSN